MIFWSEEQIWSSQCSFCQLIPSSGKWTEVQHIVYNLSLFSILQTLYWSSIQIYPVPRQMHQLQTISNLKSDQGSRSLSGQFSIGAGGLDGGLLGAHHLEDNLSWYGQYKIQTVVEGGLQLAAWLEYSIANLGRERVNWKVLFSVWSIDNENMFDINDRLTQIGSKRNNTSVIISEFYWTFVFVMKIMKKYSKSQGTKFVRSSNMTVSCIKRKYALWILRSSDE